MDPLEVADALTAVGLAVDGIVNHIEPLRQVVIAEVLDVKPHPTRDSLRLVRIRTGQSAQRSVVSSVPPPLPQDQIAEELTVVCGAKNVPGPTGLVVFAGLGVRLPGVDFVLARREIGGIPSEGMLCSESELGLTDSSEGILTFEPGTFPPGARFVDVFPEARDVIYELDVTPNRPDALGHVGVARDMGAFFEAELVVPETPKTGREAGEPIASLLSVSNQQKDRCLDYRGAVVRDVTIRPSPAAVRWRLHRLGIRPVSNVVDVTNWLLLEYGQPMHAFDLRSVRGSSIEIRSARQGESITTLDGEARKLHTEDLLICDAEGPTALAGVMGGANSEITADTTDVFLESAYFQPPGIRRTARRHSLHTEASHRFERGTDPGAVGLVLDRARQLLVEWADGSAAPGVLVDAAPKPELPLIELSSARLDSLLGVTVPFKLATHILHRLGFETEYLADTKEGPVASVRGAYHRPDVSLEEDLIEEVARIRGLDKIPTVVPAIPPQEPRLSDQLERRAARTAVDLGLSEALTHAFVSEQDLRALSAPPAVVSLKNPLSEERSVLRTSLAPGLLEALRRSRRRGQPSVRLFTIGAIFLPPHTEQPASEARPRARQDEGKLPYEPPTFAALLAGPRDEHLTLTPSELDIYDAKGLAIELIERMTRRRATVQHVGTTVKTRHLHPRGAAQILVDGTCLGTFGPLHPDVVEHFDLGGDALLIEIDLAMVEAIGQVIPRYVPIPKLPAIVRDLSLVVSEETSAAAVAQALQRASGELCESVELAAEFRGGSVPEGHRSLTFRVTYRDPAARTAPDQARTLTDKEVEGLQKKALDHASKDVGATLRG